MGTIKKHKIVIGIFFAVLIIGSVALIGKPALFRGAFKKIMPIPKTIQLKTKPIFKKPILNFYNIYPTTNEQQGINTFDDEEPHNMVAVERGIVTVIVPAGYEDLGKAHVDDLVRCNTLLLNFLGITFPVPRIKLKIYISNDSLSLGFSFSNQLFYKRTQENIDFDLRDVRENSQGSFLYNSGSEYCANTHELTHAFLSHAPIPSWANEGLAEYSQKINQPGSKDSIECQANGVLRQNTWVNPGERALFSYSDLSAPIGNRPEDGPVWYNTAMCSMQEFFETFGSAAMQRVISELSRYATHRDELLNPALDARGSEIAVYVEDVLRPILGERIYEILAKYGIDENDIHQHDGPPPMSARDRNHVRIAPPQRGPPLSGVTTSLGSQVENLFKS